MAGTEWISTPNGFVQRDMDTKVLFNNGNVVDSKGNPIGTGTNNGYSTGQGIVAGVGAVTGLANAYLGYKNYQLAKDTFDFNKAATNRNIANQGLAYNSQLDQNTGIGSALGGLDKAASQNRLDANKDKYMNTTAIA